MNIATNVKDWLPAIVCLCVVSLAGASQAQSVANPLQFKVDRPTQRLEMIVNSSRILTLDKEIPKALVSNTDLVRVVPLSPNQVQISAIKAGVTQVNLWDEDDNIYSVDVIIIPDARELEMLLKSEFPSASLRVRPLATSVVLSGYVDRPEMVSRVVRMAEDYYPKVINNISVAGVQQVQLHVKVMEVSRTKLRALSLDWATANAGDFFVQGVGGLLTGNLVGTGGEIASVGNETVSFGVLDGDSAFFGFLEALRENNLVKVLSEPTVIAVNGRPAAFNVGGEFPILVPQSLGTIAIEYKQFGTRIDFVPFVLGNGYIQLEVRPQVSELDNSNGVTLAGQRVPGLRTRWADTKVEMRAGQTLALAGLVQHRTEAQNRGVPWLSDVPWLGAAFRKVQEVQNEVELLVLVRPELVDAMDPHEVPPCGPGEQMTSPNDVELYWRGYIEVPKCCPDGSTGPAGPVPWGAPGIGPGGTVEPIPPGSQQPAPAADAPPSARAVRGTNPIVRLAPQRSSQPAANRPVSAAADPILSYDRHNAPHVTTNSSATSDPGLFGRVGYDVLDYKE